MTVIAAAKVNLSDFGRGMVVGVRQVDLSISKTAGIFPHSQLKEFTSE